MSTFVETSKMIARWLRHRPQQIGIQPDRNGWVAINDLLAKARAAGHAISIELLHQVVAENDKKRFTISDDGAKIRAAQGHSIDVDVQARVKAPPPVLYHGTVPKFVASIKKQGLMPGTRLDVHLSPTREVAETVARRRGVPVIIKIETFPMVRDGYEFRVSDNGVWLVDRVPPKYLIF